MALPDAFMNTVFRFPFSGSVSQDIEPRLFSPDYKGVPEIEAKIATEVAGYGKQLGWVVEALQALSQTTDTPLPKIDQLAEDVDAIKTRVGRDLEGEAEAALERLRAADPALMQRVISAALAKAGDD